MPYSSIIKIIRNILLELSSEFGSHSFVTFIRNMACFGSATINRDTKGITKTLLPHFNCGVHDKTEEIDINIAEYKEKYKTAEDAFKIDGPAGFIMWSAGEEYNLQRLIGTNGMSCQDGVLSISYFQTTYDIPESRIIIHKMPYSYKGNISLATIEPKIGTLQISTEESAISSRAVCMVENFR